MLNNNKILKDVQSFTKENIEDLFIFGSQVYQTNNYQSDIDLMCVVKNKNNQEIQRGLYNIHYITKEHFQDLLNQHKIKIMECYFSSQNFIIKNDNKYQFKLDKKLLREEISSKSSNSFVKCKKKLTIPEEDNYIGLKSLFHSLRILSFGIQIAQYNTIQNYSSMNIYYQEIMNIKDWDTLKEKFQPIYNQLKSEFKILCPKN